MGQEKEVWVIPCLDTIDTPFWQLLSRPGAKYSHRLYDVLIGGFASAGQVDKVKYYEAVIRRQRLRLSARGFSLVIKGYLKNGFVDEASILIFVDAAKSAPLLEASFFKGHITESVTGFWEAAADAEDWLWDSIVCHGSIFPSVFWGATRVNTKSMTLAQYCSAIQVRLKNRGLTPQSCPF